MNENKSTPFNFWPIILIFLGATGLIPTIESLDTSRPAEKEWMDNQDQQKVEGRLWEDPLAVVARNKIKIMDEISKSLILKDETKIIELKGNNTLDVITNELSRIEKLDNKNNILFVLLPAGEYIENAEIRRRTRYAVVSALSTLSYVPNEISSLQLLNYEYKKQLTLISYELYKNKCEKNSNCKSEDDKTIVVWLPENLVSSDEIKDFLSGDSQKYFTDTFSDIQYSPRIRIIGPSSSNKLNAIYEKFWEKPINNNIGYERLLLSPRATQTLTPSQHSSQIIRTIGEDEWLAKSLVWELHERGINKKCGTDEIVLISEFDSTYAHSLKEDLKKHLKKNCTNDNSENVTKIHEFHFLRGLDGQLAGKDLEKNYPLDRSIIPSINSFQNYLEKAFFESAEGMDQYDYLIRMAQKIKEIDTKSNIKAIGIIGNDIYDKLLILKALNGYFDNKIYFTTDLDARFLHSKEKKWTRNLVVASNFDLELHSSLQNTSPPFRDGYQTSVYLTILLALQSDVEWIGKLDKWLNPKIFEIGHTKAVPIPEKLTKETLTNSLNNKSLINKYLHNASINNTCSAVSIFLCESISPNDINKDFINEIVPSLGFFFVLIPIIILSLIWIRLINSKNEETFYKVIFYLIVFFTPAIIFIEFAPDYFQFWSNFWSNLKNDLRLLIWCLFLSLIVAFLYILFTGLRDSFQRFISLISFSVLFILLFWVITAILLQEEKEPLVLLEGVSVWPTFIVRLIGLFVVISLLILYIKNMRKDLKEIIRTFKLKKEKSDKSYKIIRSWNERIFIGPNFDFQKCFLFYKNKDIYDVWRMYFQLTQIKEMCGWIILFSLSLWLLAFLLLNFTGFPSFPHRGDGAKFIHFAFLFFTIPFLWILTFWVGYEVTICSNLIKTLSENRISWSQFKLFNDNDKNIDSLQFNNLSKLLELKQTYLNFKFIAYITERFGKLIFLPFVLIFFMIIARNELFDRMNFPLPLIFINAFIILYILIGYYNIRSKALQLRAIVLNSCEKALFNIIHENDIKSDKYVQEVKEIMNLINTEKRGVYARFSDRPAVQAVLLPFGGWGGSEFIKWLTLL